MDQRGNFYHRPRFQPPRPDWNYRPCHGSYWQDNWNQGRLHPPGVVQNRPPLFVWQPSHNQHGNWSSAKKQGKNGTPSQKKKNKVKEPEKILPGSEEARKRKREETASKIKESLMALKKAGGIKSPRTVMGKSQEEASLCQTHGQTRKKALPSTHTKKPLLPQPLSINNLASRLASLDATRLTYMVNSKSGKYQRVMQFLMRRQRILAARRLARMRFGDFSSTPAATDDVNSGIQVLQNLQAVDLDDFPPEMLHQLNCLLQEEDCGRIEGNSESDSDCVLMEPPPPLTISVDSDQEYDEIVGGSKEPKKEVVESQDMPDQVFQCANLNLVVTSPEERISDTNLVSVKKSPSWESLNDCNGEGDLLEHDPVDASNSNMAAESPQLIFSPVTPEYIQTTSYKDIPLMKSNDCRTQKSNFQTMSRDSEDGERNFPTVTSVSEMEESNFPTVTSVSEMEESNFQAVKHFERMKREKATESSFQELERSSYYNDDHVTSPASLTTIVESHIASPPSDLTDVPGTEMYTEDGESGSPDMMALSKLSEEQLQMKLKVVDWELSRQAALRISLVQELASRRGSNEASPSSNVIIISPVMTTLAEKPLEKKTHNSHSMKRDIIPLPEGKQSDEQAQIEPMVDLIENLCMMDHNGAVLDIKVAYPFLFTASEDGTVRCYRLGTRESVRVYNGHRSSVRCLFLDTSQQPVSDRLFELVELRVFTGCHDKRLREFAAATGEIISSVEVMGEIWCLDLNWGHVFMGLSEGYITSFNMQTRVLNVTPISCGAEPIISLKTTTEGGRRVLIIVPRDHSISIRDAFSGLLLRTFQSHSLNSACCMLLDAGWLYCSTISQTIELREFSSGVVCSTFHPGGVITAMALWQQYIMAASLDGYIYVFQCSTRDLVAKVRGAGLMIQCLAISNGKIFSGNTSGYVQIQDIESIPELRDLC